MRKLIYQHTISFNHAFDGLWWAFTSQPNFRIHFLLSLCSLALSYVLQITRIEWIIIIFTIILGITGELMNTAFEAMTDLISQEWRKEAKIAKDVAAGLMLFIAIGSVVIAFVVFGPYLMRYVSL